MIDVKKEDRVMTLTINRPEALNAANNSVFEGIRDGLLDAESDSGIAVAVITGAGRAFCAGADLGEMNARNRGEDTGPSQFPSALKTVTQFRKPLIAAVNGLGVGIGMTILSHCDLVLMSLSHVVVWMLRMRRFHFELILTTDNQHVGRRFGTLCDARSVTENAAND